MGRTLSGLGSEQGLAGSRDCRAPRLLSGPRDAHSKRHGQRLHSVLPALREVFRIADKPVLRGVYGVEEPGVDVYCIEGMEAMSHVLILVSVLATVWAARLADEEDEDG